MADSLTTNYSLTKPEDGASNNTWGAKLNTNLDTIDGLIKTNADAIAGKAALASPVFTGNPTAPTPAPGDNDTSIATTAFVVAGFLPIANPTFTGAETGPHYVANGADSNGLGYSHSRTGKVGYHLYNGGAVVEWAIYQPAHATGDNIRIASIVAGVFTDHFSFSQDGNLQVIGPDAAITISDRDGAGSWTIYDQSDILRFFNGADRFTLDGSGNVTFNGATASANIVRSGAGPHLYHVTAAFGSGRVYVTAAGAADPTSSPGDIWIELS
jgi:hypothetical protein